MFKCLCLWETFIIQTATHPKGDLNTENVPWPYIDSYQYRILAPFRPPCAPNLYSYSPFMLAVMGVNVKINKPQLLSTRHDYFCPQHCSLSVLPVGIHLVNKIIAMGKD